MNRREFVSAAAFVAVATASAPHGLSISALPEPRSITGARVEFRSFMGDLVAAFPFNGETSFTYVASKPVNIYKVVTVIPGAKFDTTGTEEFCNGKYGPRGADLTPGNTFTVDGPFAVFA